MEIITGRITEDATVNTTKSGKQVVNFSIASNHGYKPNGDLYEQVTNFFRCSYWLNAGAAEILKKGMGITVYGRTSINMYENKEGHVVGALTFNVNEIKPFVETPITAPVQAKRSMGELATAAVQGSTVNDDLPF